jgi:hypothetical protein
MAIDEVAALRQDAEALRAALLSQAFPDDETARELRDRVDRYGRDLISMAVEPITIGVVGAFSVGKSMLLGTLLGRPDLLPTEQRATTGNVTALYLQPGEPGERTQFDGDAKVSYMTREELGDCVRYMLRELGREVTKVFPNADVSPLADYDPVTQDWRRLESWCRTHLWADEFGNLEHRKIAVELAAVRDAHLSAPHLLGQGVTVRDKLIREALDLGEAHPVPSAFPERMVRPAVTQDSIARDGSDLRATFPLIKRVAYQVRVDPAVWPLTGLRDGNKIVLLDFPGLTARRSALRDEYLSRTELRDIHTIITVISADNPETDVPDRFYSMLERSDRDDIGRDHLELRDSILAVGNRFDLIVPPQPAPDGPVGIDDLRALSQQLNGLCTTAPDLVQRQDERVRLVSSIVAIGLSRQPGPAGQAGRAGLAADFQGEEGDKVAAAIAAALDRAGRWRAIAARMTGTDPADPWGQALAAFAADGGMSSLRELIEDHARTHGLQNKLNAMRRQHTRMLADLPRLGRLLRSDQPVVGVNAAARQLVGELFDDLHSHYGRVYEAVSSLRDPMNLRLPDGSVLVDSVCVAAVTEVMRWPEWQTILQRCDNGFVRKAAASPERADALLDDILGTGPVGEETTRTFLVRYRATLREAVRRGRLGLAEAVRSWIQDQNEQRGDLAERLAAAETQRLLEAGLPKVSAHHGGADLTRVLPLVADLSWLGGGIAEEVSGDFDDGAADASYPLYVERALPWHSRVPEPQDDVQQQLARHQFYMFRLQRQLATCVADTLVRLIAEDLGKVHKLLQDRLQRLGPAIPDSTDLRVMFPPEPAPGPGGAPDDPADLSGADLSGAGVPGAGVSGAGPPARSPVLDYIAERKGS